VPRSTETTTPATPARVQINNSILADALAPAASSSKAPVFSPEDVFELWCEPQAVFRVRSVGRCSATLSGERVSRDGMVWLHGSHF
jgi:ribosome assembly protein 4